MKRKFNQPENIAHTNIIIKIGIEGFRLIKILKKMEKTKIIKILTILWVVFTGVYEANVLDFLPEVNNWIKLIIALLVVLMNYLNGKMVQAKSITPGGIKNPPPKP